MHGLFSWNSAAHALLKELGGSDPANMREFQARFAAPVRPGDGLVTEAWRVGKVDREWEEVRFVVKVVPGGLKSGKEGKVVLSNGRAVMRVTGRGKEGRESKL